MMELIYRSSESTAEPSVIEICKNTVYLRKNISKYTDSDTKITYWKYQEAMLTHDEFEEYSKLMNIKKSINDEDQLIIMDAIADLYDIIANIRGGASS